MQQFNDMKRRSSKNCW